MAKMLEGVKRLYCLKDAFSRQLTLFSICGIIGLFNAFIGFEKQGLAEITLVQKYIYLILWCIFAFFLTGYEVLFLHERELPDIDMRSLKIVLNKVLLLIFFISLPLTFTAMFFPQYTSSMFFAELWLSVPLTMLQCGFSYNFSVSDVGLLFSKFGIKEYFVLIFKRLWVIFLAYSVTYVIVFVIFFIAGLAISCIYGGDLSVISLVISSKQTIIEKLANLIAGIFLIYFLTIGTLVWDYELIKTYERED